MRLSFNRLNFERQQHHQAWLAIRHGLHWPFLSKRLILALHELRGIGAIDKINPFPSGSGSLFAVDQWR